ncbi:MAG: membrane-bound PQQ-dependent dehydrogenase, glucose/quinate/shikimate family [Pseudomonadota bacterium]|nr:membrane-bound PQQ-dependent dehydrogenase, glucose/quinate/shikimate family [Pseudomonadota bacterium]
MTESTLTNASRPPRITAIVIGIFAAALFWQGATLLGMGGTPYYLVAGLAMLVAAWDLFCGRPRGFVIFSGVLLLTLAWAVYESGSGFWTVGSRIWIIGLFTVWLCLPMIRRGLWPQPIPKLFSLRSVQLSAVASALVLGAMCVNQFSGTNVDFEPKQYGPAQNASDWNAYGGNKAGTRYAPFETINANNVNQLQRAWEVRTGVAGRFSGTPLQIGDGIYLCTAQNVMISLDPDSGEERWRFDPKNETPPYSLFGNCRGVTYYKLEDVADGAQCKERIFTATTDARLIAVDKDTGLPCEDFGNDGQISLLAGMGEVKPYYYFVTSPATVASGVLVVGGWVMDNQEVEEPSGVVRAYDPKTGKLAWAWDIGREGNTQMPPDGESYTRGTPNVWSLTSADDELGLVYLPTGNATPDYFGAHRTDAMEKYASSIVAVDATTGLTRWHFQTTHHDIWDYDVPSQPTLVDLTLDGERRKAVIVPTKRGELFMLDRETGELLTEVTERPVPQTDLENEWSAPTQPFSTGMPTFAYPLITESKMMGITPFDQIACRKALLDLRYEGPLTPPSERGTLLYPGPGGGMNWGSVAVDERRQLMVVNNMHLPFTVHMIPREQDPATNGEGPSRGYGIGGQQRGTPFSARVDMFSSPLGIPCIQPPFGEMAVVDLTTQEIVWRRPVGTAAISLPGGRVGVPLEMGTPFSAGSIVTAGGLIFNGGVMDGYFRALDLFSGEELFADPLHAASGATPMSYVSPKTGKQYVLLTLPGEAAIGVGADHSEDTNSTTAVNAGGGHVVAYALPD